MLAAFAGLPIAENAAAARVVRVRTRHTRVRVTVRPGFPIRRTLPEVVVRPGPVVRVAPLVYLPAVAFTAAVITTLPPAERRVWHESAILDSDDGWTDVTLNVDKRGRNLALQIDRGAAQISFAEVVFENGDTQVVDFNDHVHRRGTYELLDFKDGRKVDHVRVVAKADTAESEITLHLVS
jgi:hypothetical protein